MAHLDGAKGMTVSLKVLMSICAAGLISAPAFGAEAADNAGFVSSQSAMAPITSVAATRTPSGFAVPRYVSLKYGEVNGRTGPSKQHPVAWRYSRRGLPVIIVAETEMWRKVRDRNGDESWMHKRTLDGRRTVIALQDVMIRTKPRESSKARAIATKDTLLTLSDCDQMGWCEVKADTGHKGYVPRKTIWGTEPL